MVKPLRARLEVGRVLYRVHPHRFEATAFNPGRGAPGRFHPIRDRDGLVIPTLYAAGAEEVALAETVFRNVVGGSRLLAVHVSQNSLTKLKLRADLHVADLRGHGLKVLGLRNRSELLDCDDSQYDRTARWAEAIHDSDPEIQGMIWISRQFDLATALLAFGDRVVRDTFTVEEGPMPLDSGEGFLRVCDAAAQAGIDVVRG